MQAKFVYAIKFVADMDRALAFYRGTMGLTEVYAVREAAGLTFTRPPEDQHGSLLSRLLDCEGVEIGLSGAPA